MTISLFFLFFYVSKYCWSITESYESFDLTFPIEYALCMLSVFFGVHSDRLGIRMLQNIYLNRSDFILETALIHFWSFFPIIFGQRKIKQFKLTVSPYILQSIAVIWHCSISQVLKFLNYIYTMWSTVDFHASKVDANLRSHIYS